MTRHAPHAQKVRVREVSTGTVIERWPVDARAIVNQSEGTWEYVRDELDAPAASATADTPTPAAATPPANASNVLSIADRLGEKSWKEIKALGKQAGLPGNLDKESLIAALVPHIEGGTVSIDEVQGLPPVLPASQFPAQAEAGQAEAS